MARAILRRALSLSAAGAPATPRLAAAFASSSAVVPLRSPLDERLLRILRSEISYIADRRPPYPAPSSFKSFTVEDRPGEQWVYLHAARAGAVTEKVKVEATMLDCTTDPLPEDAPLFQRIESLERGPRQHLSLFVEVVRGGGDRVLEFVCSAWPDELAVRHVLAYTEGRGIGCRDFVRLKAAEREAVIKFLKDREVDEQLAGFLHEYMVNKGRMELLRWLKTIESFVDK
ncbi:hypothetical protein PR202_gb23283 [Eleusine coracana subsp. coracana]|uniref:Uncharacterized protein n=1 Tax=Eleusine coracana subsp. coracana TaxID=191504 RepID=A0AAV5FJU3_ELECO|nr:hypothetical protein QOZ80_6BG0480340 [Eleusine coracana subsp. coracana]GJN34605.1 hypothetical protein PR202_gb23283 [Eleusine coracana subsp. coracana]